MTNLSNLKITIRKETTVVLQEIYKRNSEFEGSSKLYLWIFSKKLKVTVLQKKKNTFFLSHTVKNCIYLDLNV